MLIIVGVAQRNGPHHRGIVCLDGFCYRCRQLQILLPAIVIAAHDKTDLGSVGVLLRDQLILPVLGILHRVPVNIQNKGDGGILFQISLDPLQ